MRRPEPSSPLWILHRLPYREQQVLAKFAPILGALLGALAFVARSPPEFNGHFASGVSTCVCWGIGLKIGSDAKPWSLRLLGRSVAGPPGPSWTLAAFGGLLLAGLSMAILQRRDSLDTGAALAIALHVTYAGAKLRCRILRCCEPHRTSGIRKVLLASGLFLQDFEIIASLLCAMLGLVLWRDHSPVASGLGFVLHAAVRGIDWHARFPWRGPFQLMSDVGCGGFVALGSIFLLAQWW
jgi:hypothetical protein